MSGYRIDSYPIDYSLEEGLYTIQQLQYQSITSTGYSTYNEYSYLDVLNSDFTIPFSYFFGFCALIAFHNFISRFLRF